MVLLSSIKMGDCVSAVVGVRTGQGKQIGLQLYETQPVQGELAQLMSLQILVHETMNLSGGGRGGG